MRLLDLRRKGRFRGMDELETTQYFELRAKFKHPEVADEWVTRVLANPYHTETQPDGRIGYYGYISEVDK